MIVKEIKESGLKFPDIREKEWMSLDTKVSKLLKLLIEAENILMEFDEYQLEHNQCYPKIEDMMLQLGDLRNSYSNYIDDNMEILKI